MTEEGVEQHAGPPTPGRPTAEAGDPAASPMPEEGDGGTVAHVLLLATLVIDAGLAAAMAWLNRGFGHGPTHLIGTALWVAVAALNVGAAWNLVGRTSRRFANTILAQGTALVMALYVLVVAYGSPGRHLAVEVTAAAVALAAVWWIAFLLHTAPTSSARTFGRSWKVVAASFSLLGLFSLWLQTSYLPSTERPQVDMTTSLTKVESNGQRTVLKATITLHNRGEAAAVVVGSAYRVTNTPEVKLPYTGPLSIDALDVPLGSELTHRYDVLAQAFDLTAPNTHDFEGPYELVAADEIMPMRDFLLPGQTWATETVVEVPNTSASTVRLTAQIALVTERYLGDTTPCDHPDVDQYDPGFGELAHEVRKESASAASGLPSEWVDSSIYAMCLQTALEPQSEVQSLLADDPRITTSYVLAGDPGGLEDYPVLVAAYAYGDGGRPTVDDVRKIDERNPSAVIDSRSEYGIPGPAT